MTGAFGVNYQAGPCAFLASWFGADQREGEGPGDVARRWAEATTPLADLVKDAYGMCAARDDGLPPGTEGSALQQMLRAQHPHSR